jgi:hypothetical protein
MDHQAQVRQMLRRHTPAEFVKLSLEERNAVYERHLVTENMVQIEEGDDDDFFNPELAKGVLLRQEYMVGDDEAGKQIAKEAREMYYSQNTFTVRSHWLAEFIWDTLADGKPLRIEDLVRKIMVRVDVVNAWAEDDEDLVTDGEDELASELYSLPLVERRRRERERKKLPRMPRTAHELRRLLAFERAEWVGIEIHGSGALDGSDAGTQKKIKDISSVVKQLIIKFPSQLTILRIEKRQRQSIAHDLRPYWDTPSPEARERVRSSTASFIEVMQTRIEEWTRETVGEGEMEP